MLLGSAAASPRSSGFSGNGTFRRPIGVVPTTADAGERERMGSRIFQFRAPMTRRSTAAEAEPPYLQKAKALDRRRSGNGAARSSSRVLGARHRQQALGYRIHHMVRTTRCAAGMGAAWFASRHHTVAGAVYRCNGACYLDPFLGAQLAVAEASRNVACAGGEPIGATNCLNFGNPQKPEIMWQFAKAVEGMGAACRALGIPITGGNVSLYNETDGRGVLPTPVIGVVGLIEHADRVVRRPFQSPGDAVVLLGDSLDGWRQRY